jgi:aminoglycoside phosphotransferase (APT) family kinase protein
MTTPTQLQQALETALAPAIVNNLTLIAGGASQETWRCDLLNADGSLTPLIVRRPLGGSIYDTSLDLEAEYRVHCAAHSSGVAVPRPYTLLDDLLGTPAVLVERLDAESIGRKLVREPRFAHARSLLPTQMGAALAVLHAVDLERHELWSCLPAPPPGKTPAQIRLDQIEQELDAVDEPHPALELCLRWLRRNEPPPPDRPVLVHGDYRIGNMLVHTKQGLVGVIDWEFAHIGDYAEDLTWGLIREWRFGVDELRLGGIAQPDAFFAAYTQHSGRAIDQARIAYWELLGNVWWAIGCLNQARRHLRGEQTNIEFVSLGRRAAEMEYEALRLLENSGVRSQESEISR